MTKQRLITIGLILIGLLVALFFGMKTVLAFKHLRGHGPFNGKPPSANQTDVELIRDWMTIPYIADTYGTPPDVLYFSLGIPHEKRNGRKSLKQLNDEYFPNQPDVVLLQIKTVIRAFQTQTLPPPPLTPAAPSLPAKTP